METSYFRTEKQANLLKKLVRSSAFSTKEREDTLRWLDTASCSIDRCELQIDKAFARLRKPKSERAIANRIDALTFKIKQTLDKIA